MPKTAQEETIKHNLSSINKQILEVKKKIQLSEGQRKALFEDCEAERRANIEEIAKLKKENSDLIASLHEYTSSTAKLDVQKRKIEHLIGPIDNKEGDELQELLDLQLIDKSKQLDLLRYNMKKKRKDLSELGKKYQILLSEQAKRETILKVDVPVKKAACEIQNNIHAVEVQLREAEHIKNRYQVIKTTLLEDAGRFESRIKKIEDDLLAQRNEIDKLQKILREAIEMRNNAKKILIQEEKETLDAVKQREKQIDQGKHLVSARKAELESLEKKIYLSGKISARPEPEGAEEMANQNDDDKSDSTMCPIVVLEKSFEKLKTATGKHRSFLYYERETIIVVFIQISLSAGAPTAEKTLEKFSIQKDTLNRLEDLRKKAEAEKGILEKKVERKTAELEYQKYAQVKEAERKSGEMEKKNKQLKELQEESRRCKESSKQIEATMQSTLASLQKLYIHMNPIAIIQKEPLVVVESIKRESKN
ncbi:hypothetical protein HHI36_012540 [Cryptolaemus montrouzieri]|uniref:Uncharacterized protein n=1 Tax=Cryptolaemus montrouzieri TaxID=559131 RepID=A0ABD2NFG9_9CUCU